MDAFTPFDQSDTSFTSPITDFDINGWPTDADAWNTFYSFDALHVAQPSGFTNQEDVGDGSRVMIARFGTGCLGPTNDPIGFEYVPVGSADAYRTNMIDSDKTEISELGQGSLNPTGTDLAVPHNSDGNNSVLSVTTTIAGPVSSRECSCITCLDLGSYRRYWTEPRVVHFPCRLSDCNFSTAVGSQEGEYQDSWDAELAARKHERNHFRHEGQYRCKEDRCVYVTKRWSDFRRHCTGKHCLNPKTKFPCPEIGCKYSGNNGFKREDKLKSHRRTVHEKQAKPEKRFRVSKPAVQGAA